MAPMEQEVCPPVHSYILPHEHKVCPPVHTQGLSPCPRGLSLHGDFGDGHLASNLPDVGIEQRFLLNQSITGLLEKIPVL